jgi:hypothetical protein
MSPPSVSNWLTVKSGEQDLELKIRLVEFSNYYLLFLIQGPTNRISSYVEAKRTVDRLSGQADVDVSVLFGDRDDIWGRVIARRTLDLVNKNIVLALSLTSDAKNERNTLNICNTLTQVLGNMFTT